MGIKYDRYVDGVLVESYDTRTQEDLDNEIVEKRKQAYGSVEEQLEFITENGLAAWQSYVATVKQQYPKGQ